MHLHKNSQKRIIEPNKIYSITTNTFERFPYFENKILCWLFIAQLKMTRLLKNFELYGFCILYEHVHILLRPRGKENISKIMQYLKRHFARNANIITRYQNPSSKEGDICKCRLPREYELSSKMNIYVKSLRNKFAKISNAPPPFKWQKSYHDHIIRCDKDFWHHYEYITQNLKKHHEQDYPENYKFTSLNFLKMIDNFY